MVAALGSAVSSIAAAGHVTAAASFSDESRSVFTAVRIGHQVAFMYETSPEPVRKV